MPGRKRTLGTGPEDERRSRTIARERAAPFTFLRRLRAQEERLRAEVERRRKS
jgi:hypothetical protein